MASLKRPANKPSQSVPGYIPEVPNKGLNSTLHKKIQGKLITPVEPPHTSDIAYVFYMWKVQSVQFSLLGCCCCCFYAWGISCTHYIVDQVHFKCGRIFCPLYTLHVAHTHAFDTLHALDPAQYTVYV